MTGAEAAAGKEKGGDRGEVALSLASSVLLVIHEVLGWVPSRYSHGLEVCSLHLQRVTSVLLLNLSFVFGGETLGSQACSPALRTHE